MKANDLFALMPRPLAVEILEYTFTSDKEIYTAVLDMVAQARKVRPIFLQRMPRTERFDSMATALSRPGLDMAAENLIRNWLLKKHTALLAEFLDGLNIEHEKGVVESLPETVEDTKLQQTVDKLLEKYPESVVTVYLYAFNQMNETRWINLDLILETDSRLQFNL
jgi:hypothetical protein